MSEQDESFKRKLIERYIMGQATEKELMTFFGLISENQIDELIAEYMDQDILAMMAESAPRRSNSLWRYVAAAAILFVITAGSYFFLHQTKPTEQVAQLKPGTYKNDAMPGNKAILTLANGQQLTLTALPAGKIQNTSAQKTNNGALIYRQSNAATDIYNTLTVPRGGGKHELTLADGTLVLLDAGSSITFPVAFNGKERKVSITGQAYFEVVHKAEQPFYVTVGNQTIKDIGTHFNINAFDNQIKTTLIEGSIQVDDKLLVPGQQAVVSAGKLAVLNKVDESVVLAWKNDKFKFEDNTPLPIVMNQLSRWYDMDIEYQGNGKGGYHFGGAMPRYEKLSDVLKILAFNGAQFSVEGKKIIVYQ